MSAYASVVPRFGPVLAASLVKLAPAQAARNPVMFLVWMGTLLTAVVVVRGLWVGDSVGFPIGVLVLLALTVLFANAAEAVAEARARGQAGSLRQIRTELRARRRLDDGREETVPATALRRGDRVVVEAGELIPVDGDIVEGMASINESAVTGESAPVLREAGGDRSGVIAGTLVLSDRIVVEVGADPGDSFLDRMIALVENAQRQKTPNELALTVLLAAMSLVFIIVVVTLPLLARFVGAELDATMLLALLVCLIPTTIAGLLPAIGIAGMNRAFAERLIAKSGKAVEVAGDIDTLLIDKTGTITFGNRHATAWHPVGGTRVQTLVEAAALASVADPTPEGRSIVQLAADAHGIRPQVARIVRSIAFSAQTRMSGVETEAGLIYKGAIDAVRDWCAQRDIPVPGDLPAVAERIARKGATPLAVVANRVLGVVELSDVVKPGIQSRFARLRRMGVRSVMITGDNPLTAAAIAAEAGVDDFVAEATPEAKLAAIRREQAQGRLVAMVGDGTNDAPALAQADIGLAMNAGTQAAKEAANMVDLDSDPAKLIKAVEIGKQLLATRGALTTFSLANDVAKYFAVLPALFASSLPLFAPLDVMRLHSPQSAVLSALIYNALIIPALIPLALRGIATGAEPGDVLLQRNLAIYGLGGVVAPFAAIKLIDLLLAATGLF
ncbi:potassium-transporting ATPase subunit KdpB [Sinimarinibacterium flocculans]|uniref:potassium-transporting ATPase subunit KdpB n=1 Tax=Sinimarinibacterium flocculans TaxID=985250 RepID=UPI0035145231